jgi:hypothetical protein
MGSSEKFLEVKHHAPSVLCFKTRGQLTVGVLDDDFKTITAKAGISAPKVPEGNGPKDHLQNDWMLRLFLERDSSTSLASSEFVSMRAMTEQGLDLVSIDKNKRVNMEYDWNRELVEPRMEIVGKRFRTSPNKHLTLSSRPWKTVEDFQRCRSTFDEWRLKDNGVLKTIEDWDRWSEYQTRSSLRLSGDLKGKGKLVDQAKRMFLKAYALKLWGLPGGSYADVATWLSDNGYPTSANDLKNAKRSPVDPEGLWALASEDPSVLRLTTLLKDRFTDLPS